MHNKKKRAEEILADENFSQESLWNKAEDESNDTNEIRIAQKLNSFLRSSGINLSPSEKEHTKNQIRVTIRKLSFKRRLIRVSIAASILFALIFTAVSYFRVNSMNEITHYAQTLNHVHAGKNTQLILQNGQVVQIEKKQSQIKYDAKGENIVIDSEHKVAQRSDETKGVFNTVIVPYGKRVQLTLSDGTKVWLNSGSKLIYPALFSGNKRELYIEGEAIFDVVHMDNKAFIVRTKDFDIQDLGTVFNVSTYNDDKYSSAILDQGKIELVYHGTSFLSREKMEITPGTMVIYDRNHKALEQKQVNPKKYLSWREGYLIFNSEKLENILRKLGRYYNIEMVITDDQLKNETFSGLLDLKNSPEEVLAIINETTALSFSLSSGKIFINPKKMPM